MYSDTEEVKEAWQDYEAGLISGMDMMDIFDSWDGDPIEVIG
jgi:hypothetical protein